MDSEKDINDLKEIVKRQGVVIDETNKMLHSMRRSQRMRMLFSIVWWLVIFGVSAGAYYIYVQPYVDRAIAAYENVQHGTQEARNWEQQAVQTVQGWFKEFGGSTTTPQ